MATKKKAKATPAKAKKAAPQKSVKAKSLQKKAANKKAAQGPGKKKVASKGAPRAATKNTIASKKVVSRMNKDKATGKKVAQSDSIKKTGSNKSGALAKVKKTASNIAIKAVKAVAKVITKQNSKQIKDFKPKTPVITHGEDMHLIPVQGEIHPARRDDASLLEKQFRHNQQIAWQREQQLMRQVQSQTAARKVFRTPRHS